MESGAYEGGGAGGKLRRRILRRAAAPTPYDRPPTAARGGHGRRNGWLSRLVDPASRIITGGASRLFSSVFRKPLPSLPAPPPPPSDENLQLIDEDPQDVCLKSLSEVQEKGKRDGKEIISNSESDGISELEQLMKQKTFTRAEFNYLTELLQRRTIESMRTEPMDDNMEFSNAEKDKGTGQTFFDRNTTPSNGGLSVPKEEASPAEIAKEYMGSRPSKLPSLRHSRQSLVSREDATLPNGIPFAVKPPDLSVAPRSIVPFRRVSEQPENGYFTPRSRGRSAIYRMCRSPYFKVQTAANAKGGMPAGESSASSQWTTTTNLLRSGGKQALKRGSSVLDSDFGSFGPIRRIRQRSNLVSPLKERKSLWENLLPSASTPLSKDAIPMSESSIQRHLQINMPRHGSGHSVDAEHDDTRSSYDGVPPIPHQSGEMARKILQQLDKLLPSPKEKSSELKAITRDESPSKLTLDMLNGRALRSIEHIGPANFANAQSSDSVDAINGSDPERMPQKQGIQGNGPSKSVISNAMTSGFDSKFCVITPSTDAKSDKRVPEVAFTESSTIILHKKPAFKISAPEDSLDMEEDNDDFAITAAPGSAANGKDKQDSNSHSISVISETQISEKLVASSPQNMHLTSTKLFGEFDGKSSDRPAPFSFPLTSVSSTIVQPPTPTMPVPKPEISALTKEETLAAAFNPGSKDAPTTVFSLNNSDPAGFKSDKDHVSEPELSIRNTSPLAQAEGLNLDRGDKIQKASKAFKSFGGSSDLPTSSAASTFALGASVPSLNNGSLNPNPPAMFGSGNPNSGSQLSSNLYSSSSAPSSSNSISSFSSAAAMSPTGAAFKFGSGTTTSSFSLASMTLETIKTPVFKFGSDTTTSAFSSVSTPEAGKKPTFNYTYTFGSSAANTESSSSTGCSGSSTLLISSPLSSANINSAPMNPSAFSSTGTVAAPSLFTSTVSGTAAQAGSSLFSCSGSSSSASMSSVVPSTTVVSHSASSTFPFSSTGNGIFGFGASAQSSDSSLMLSSSSSQNTSNFGATASPIFGAQGASSASENSNISQGIGQLSSFSSNPSFGMTGSPSFGFSSSPFGAAASSVKPFSSGSGFTFSASASSSSAGSSSSFATSASGLFGLASQSSSASLNTAFGSSSSPSAGLTFGMPAPASGGSTSAFGSSTGSVFSFNSAAAASTTASAQPSFGASPVASFGSGFPQNDQMSVEDSMTDDAVQPTVSAVPAFGQPSRSPTPPSFMFGSPAVPSGGQAIFQFGNQNSVPPGASSFQPSGTLEFSSGGSFSLGSGGDKSTRKIVRVRRNKPGVKK